MTLHQNSPATHLATVAVASSMLLSACGDSGPPTTPTGPISAVTLNYSTATIAKGQGLVLVATALDGAGNAVAGRAISWTSDNSGVRVESTGRITGEARGSARITATADGKSGTANITVVEFATIQPGMRDTCALSTTGRLFCAGTTYGAMARSQPGAPLFVSLTSNSEPEGSDVAHFCGVEADGTASCWGANVTGQLGVGDLNSRTNPVPLTGIKFQEVSAGQHHTCGLATTGQVYCWGGNDSQQLGTGNSLDRHSPVPAGGGFIFVQVVAGNFHTCALDGDGQAWCWGRNNRGQLGRGTAGDPAGTPLPVAGGHRFRTLASKWNWTCGLTELGSALCWGDNTLGQLGSTGSGFCEEDKPCARVPSPVNAQHPFTSLAMSQFATCGVTLERRIYCWGGDMQSQFGAPSPPPACPVSGSVFGCTPSPTAGPQGFLSLSGSPRSFCGISSEGIAYCWGGNNNKQLGNPSVTTMTPIPVVFSIDPVSAP